MQVWIGVGKEELPVVRVETIPLEIHHYCEISMLIDIVLVAPFPDFMLDLQYQNNGRRRFDFKPLLVS